MSIQTKTRPALRGLSAALCLGAFLMQACAARAEEAKAGADARPEPVTKVRVVSPDGRTELVAPEPSEVERYCAAIADPARDTRAGLQQKRLQELEAQVSAKVDELEAKRREYQDWLEQRRAFIESTSTIMLDIYAKMKPDAAASQLAGIERTTAASIIAKLKSRQAGDILAEMPAEVAAEIANLIVEKTDKAAANAVSAKRQG
ncbi:MotE family protein [Aurantimonas sp. Leaf443]|uniref:MotE family protein n=1 Tax=Aurantimonas sp. Leaf443 TaxID=1736378 RepID=UPI0006FBF729|nr:MotE family protein [Aurantimonas sp. Leaf443]KQT86016.1 hypothetical protein ASG48_05360 [Aurantimonas sp. Leaf443]